MIKESHETYETLVEGCWKLYFYFLTKYAVILYYIYFSMHDFGSNFALITTIFRSYTTWNICQSA